MVSLKSTVFVCFSPFQSLLCCFLKRNFKWRAVILLLTLGWIRVCFHETRKRQWQRSICNVLLSVETLVLLPPLFLYTWAHCVWWRCTWVLTGFFVQQYLHNSPSCKTWIVAFRWCSVCHWLRFLNEFTFVCLLRYYEGVKRRDVNTMLFLYSFVFFKAADPVTGFRTEARKDVANVVWSNLRLPSSFVASRLTLGTNLHLRRRL